MAKARFITLEVWKELTLMQQMANIGNEINKAFSGQRKAVDRVLKLLSWTLECNHRPAANKEITLVKEAVIDYFYGTNEFSSSEILWQRYFRPFMYVARKINGKL